MSRADATAVANEHLLAVLSCPDPALRPPRSSLRTRCSWSRLWIVIRSSKRSNLRARSATALLVCLSSAESFLVTDSAALTTSALS